MESNLRTSNNVLKKSENLMQNSLTVGGGGGGEGIGEKHTGRVGTPLYCSPEVLKGGMYNEKVDLFIFYFFLF